MNCPRDDHDCDACRGEYEFTHPAVEHIRRRAQHHCGCDLVADDGHPRIVTCVGCGARIDEWAAWWRAFYPHDARARTVCRG